MRPFSTATDAVRSSFQMSADPLGADGIEYLVIGAGLQGASIALELARRGEDVLLVEQDAQPMNRASLRNEGKIHLGLIYAADPSGKTARLQLDGALRFAPLLRRWLGARWDAVRLSTPFVYLVARDSLLDHDQLATHYAGLTTHCRQALTEDAQLDYLGLRPDTLAEPVSLHSLAGHFDTARLSAAFTTRELAIDTDDLAREVARALQDHPRIRLTCGAQVTGLSQRDGGWEVSMRVAGRPQEQHVHAGVVFNATWDERIGLDSLAGLAPPAGWVHRLKYRVIARIPPRAARDPSATMVLGPYGDVVIRGSTAYLSWYPTGLRGWSHDLRPPGAWSAVTSAHADDPERRAIGREILARTLDWYPALAGSELLSVDAGAIFAYGTTDVDRADSGLHDRTRIGVRRLGNYLSIDPGKLTTAPMFAVDAVNQVLGVEGGL